MELSNRWLDNSNRTGFVFLRAPVHEFEVIGNIIFTVTGRKQNVRVQSIDGKNCCCMTFGIDKEQALKVDEIMGMIYE
jgi:hypothetical protein